MQLSVIIVNYNSGQFLENCLDSIIKFTDRIEYEITVIDNNSNDSDIKKLPQKFPTVKFLFLNNNIGFGAACNYGTLKTDSVLLVFVNPDIVFTSDVLYPICKDLIQKSELGICSPALVSSDNTYQSSTGFKMGIIFEFLEAFWLIDFYRRFQKIFYRKRFNISKPFKVGWVSGAIMIMRRDVFERVNGFDEEYFLNYEDIDLCRKIENAGFENYYYPDLKCVHVGSVSQRRNFESLVLSRYKSRLTYSKKYYSPMIRIGVRLIHIVGLVLRIAVLFFRQDNIENKQRLSGYKKALIIYLNRES